MEPITFTAIVAALSAGVATGIGDSALVNAYQGLKAALKTKSGDRSDIVKAIDMLEKRPDSEGCKRVLQEEVERAGADQDTEVRKAAQELLEQVKTQPGGEQHVQATIGKQWDPSLGVKVLRLEVLSRKESIALLRKQRPDLSEDDVSLDSIAGELGDLSLAVDLAGKYLARYRFKVKPGEYLTQLRSAELFQHRFLQKVKGISSSHHEMDVFRAFALSYEQLDTADRTGSLAVAVLVRASRFTLGEPIPRDLLLLSLDLPEEDSEEARLRTAGAISRLVELGLLREQELGSLTLHRLLGIFVRAIADDAHAQSAVEKALVTTAGALLDKGYPKPLVALLPHLRAVTDDVVKEREDEQAAALCDRLGRCLVRTVAYTEARPYLERALVLREKVLGEEHPDTAESLRNLGNVSGHQGKYKEASSLYKRALATREKVLGEEHPDTAQSLNNLAHVLAEQGKYRKARSLYERALATREKVLGEEHPDTAWSLHTLALMLTKQGEYQKARLYIKRALAIREKVMGEEHPDTVNSLNILTNILWYQGKYQEARPLYERALAIREKVMGEEHPDTAESLHNLANVLRDQGEYQEARPLYERALAIWEEVLGEKHPNTKMARLNLTILNTEQKVLSWVGLAQGYKDFYSEGRALYKQDRHDEALEAFEEAIRLKPDYPDAWANKGVTLSKLGRHDEALEALDQAISLKPDEPQTWFTRGLVLDSLDRDDEALGALDRAISLRPDYPEAWYFKGVVLGNLGRYDEALEAYDKALRLKPYYPEALNRKVITLALAKLGR